MSARSEIDRARELGRSAWQLVDARLDDVSGGGSQKRAIFVFAVVLGLSTADTSTVGASATELRHALGISNTQVGLLVTVTSLVAALAALPFGVLADRVRRTWTLAAIVLLWGGAMIWSATARDFQSLLVSRAFLGAVTAAGGPLIASLVGDYFPPATRGRIYGFILTGELVGAGFGFAVSGDIATVSWRAAFVVLALPAFVLAWVIAKLPEPERGGSRSRAGGDEESGPTDAQRLAHDQGVEPDPELVLHGDIRRMNLIAAGRHVLRVRTNVILIGASALGYYFLAGVQTFGIEFSKAQYGIGQLAANAVLLIVGVGAVLGVLSGGSLGDRLVSRGRLNGRVLTAAVAGAVASALFVPAIFTHDVVVATLILMGAVFALSAQNPPLDAARLDIMPPPLWGRAESIRSVLRALAQALAPVLFGAVADYVFGGGHSGLHWTFAVMVLPLAAGSLLLFAALRTFPQDVATAAASEDESQAEVVRAAA